MCRRKLVVGAFPLAGGLPSTIISSGIDPLSIEEWLGGAPSGGLVGVLPTTLGGRGLWGRGLVFEPAPTPTPFRKKLYVW